MPKKTLAPKQARSRETYARLMRATRELLNDKGIEGATVPRVAARARVSPAAVYRRFPNKDALMRAVILETLESLDAATTAALTPELAERLSLQAFAETMVRQSLASQRRNATMLRAMRRFIESHPSTPFKKRVAALNIRSIERVAEFLQRKRHDMRHPNPAKGVPFALMMVGFALQEIVVADILPDMPDPRLPATDDDLVSELVRAFLGYLGATYEQKPR
ncbi:MAG TPA: TetR/AcrR family transcriptional regulator [Candidatus Eremiobacteraceae bacterium]|nr:TetR/AcrR family transcriptional regulator [Candidatus Eremiobacteraceae bacterium]